MSSLGHGESTKQTPTKRRRPHNKTKSGCLDCRRRRIKCGEERPSCRSCVRRNVSCVYTSEPRAAISEPSLPRTADDHYSSRRSTPVLNPDPDPPTRASSLLSAPTPGDLSSVLEGSATPSVSFGIRDLALLHHWTVCTSVDIYKSPNLDVLWQVIFPQIGFRHPFVAHGILSLAALHLAHIDGSKNSPYVMEATQHHEEAMKGFCEAVDNVGSNNHEALLAWSLINILYVFSITKQLPGGVERDASRLRRDRVLGVDWIPMIRGVDAVLGPAYDYLKDGRMKSVLDLGNWNDIECDQVPSEPMDCELCRTQDAWKNSNDAEVYDQALYILRKCQKYILQFDTMDPRTLEQWGCNRAWAAPLAFIHFAPQSFFTMLHQRQPPALILFAFFGVLLHGINGYWFLEGWGKDIIEVVDELLGSFWRPWLLLPLQTVGLD